MLARAPDDQRIIAGAGTAALGRRAAGNAGPRLPGGEPQGQVVGQVPAGPLRLGAGRVFTADSCHFQSGTGIELHLGVDVIPGILFVGQAFQDICRVAAVVIVDLGDHTVGVGQRF